MVSYSKIGDFYRTCYHNGKQRGIFDSFYVNNLLSLFDRNKGRKHWLSVTVPLPISLSVPLATPLFPVSLALSPS